MSNKTWQQISVATPADQAAHLIPHEIAVGRATLEISAEKTAEAAYWGRDAARFPARWSYGRWDADAYVEVRPYSRHAAEVVVHMRSPAGFLGWLTWPSERLDRQAASLAQALRYEIGIRTESGTSPVSVRRMPVLRSRTA